MPTVPSVRASATRILLTVLALGWFLPSGPPAAAQLTTLGSQYFDQDSSGIEGEAEADDLFGGALAVGDFNCDGFADLAIGVPYEDVAFDCNGDGTADANECGSAGAVNVIYGSARGLHPSAGDPDQILSQATSGVLGSPEHFDHFGYALAAVRTPGRSCDDLAVGVPDEDVTDGPVTHVEAGIVQYFRGTSSGLVADGQFVQGRDGVPGNSEDDDRFGSSLAMGPDLVGHDYIFECPAFRGAGTLLIGAPGEDAGIGTDDEGLVTVVVAPCDLSGAGSGDLPSRFNCGPFSPSADCQAVSVGQEEANDSAGTAVAGGWRAADPIDGYMAIGVPGDNFGGSDSGSVDLWMSEWPSGAGSFDFERTCAQGWDQAPGSAESNDELGHALATGDFDGDGDDDLAAGVIYEDVNSNSVTNAGGVSIFYTAKHTDINERYPTGGGPPAGQFFDQDDMNSAFTAETSDHFGGALATGDFDGDGRDDLAVGVPDENVNGNADAGAFHVLYGQAGGLSTVGAQAFTLETGAIPGGPQPFDHLSYSMAAGDFDGDGRDDLAVSTPSERLETSYGGGVFVLYGGRPSSALCNLVLSVSDTTPSETVGTITVSVERTDNAILPIDFHYDWSNPNSTATGGLDFTDFFGTLSWSAGERGVKTFQIELLDDTLAENAETLAIDSSETPNVCDGPATLVLNIGSNDVAGSMQFQSPCAIVTETVPSLGVTVTRTGGAASGVTVHYATSNGTATAGADYTAASGTLTFGAGQTTQGFSIPILNDAVKEAARETIVVTLSSPGGFGTLGTRTTEIVSITDDDGDPIVFANNFECGDTAAWSDTVP